MENKARRNYPKKWFKLLDQTLWKEMYNQNTINQQLKGDLKLKGLFKLTKLIRRRIMKILFFLTFSCFFLNRFMSLWVHGPGRILFRFMRYVQVFNVIVSLRWTTNRNSYVEMFAKAKKYIFRWERRGREWWSTGENTEDVKQ